MNDNDSAKGRVAADTLVARLLLLRREMGWTQREAAEATGVPFGVWQGMEAKRETRGLDRHIVKIADTTGYDRDWLMWGGPLSPPSPLPSIPADNERPLYVGVERHTLAGHSLLGATIAGHALAMA